jgi:hypothetical protein
MTPKVQQFYKFLYDKAKSLPNSNALGILPTHFVGKKSQFKKGLPLFVGRDANGLGQIEIPIVSDYEYDALEWLKNKDGYYFDTSPFWRTIGHTLAQMRKEPYGANVFHDFYWSDLYKINFRAKKGTTQGLRSKQINECTELLLAEMDDLEPCISIFLTGVYESGKGIGRFFERWEPKGQLESKNEVTGEFHLIGETGKIHHCIVAPHPQGKSHERLIQSICKIIKTL